jgi:hypothetical protein
MLAARIVVAFSLTLSLGVSLGACHRDRCVSVCEQRVKELGCSPGDSCKTTCDQLRSPSPCAAAFHGWEDCIVGLPASQWQCNEASLLTPKPGACAEARAKVQACLESPPTPAPPPKN